MASAADVPEAHARLTGVFGHETWSPAPHPDPLGGVIRTLIGQHTSGTNSRRAFTRLRECYPAWEAVRDAPVEGIEGAIRCAGLSRMKAPRIKAILLQVTAERGGLDRDDLLAFLAGLPDREAMAWLRRLPGVGQTTAACVLLFGLGRPVMPVDGGILRVARRLGVVGPRAAPEEVQGVLEGAVPPAEVYPLHLNLIRHGRELCLPAAPACPVCPLNDLCDHFRGEAPLRGREAGAGARAAPAAGSGWPP